MMHHFNPRTWQCSRSTLYVIEVLSETTVQSAYANKDVAIIYALIEKLNMAEIAS